MNLLHLLLFCAIVLSGKVYCDDRTPFCDLCTCLNQTMTNPDVDCSSRIIKSTLYNQTLWINKENNKTYNINSLNLQSVDLFELTEVFPNSTLKILDLSNNDLRNVSVGVFANLESMEELILSHNKLDYLTPDVFKGLRLDGYDYPLQSLRVLRLDHNNFHTLHQDIFQHIDRNIKVLDLSYNPFKVLDQSTIIAITTVQFLEELDLSYTQLTDLPQYFLHTPKYLKKLDLSGNLFEKIPKTLEDAHSLEELVLDSNPIVNLTEENGFPIVPSLKKLHMCNMPKLVEISKHSMSGLENIEELHITENIALSTIHYGALTRLDVENIIWPPVKKLHITNNKLTHLSSTFLVRWDILTELDIRGNPWTCECENQWMIEELMPVYVGLNITQAKEVKCAAPVEMEQDTLYNIYERKSIMRCLDLYGNRPEKDGTILIGILIGILIAIPLVLFILYSYQRNWYGFFDNSPAAYSRQFYKAPSLGDDGQL